MKKSLGAKSLVCTMPVWAVGTYDKAGKANVSISAWAGICCSSPPAVYVSFRKATLTYENIRERKAFTASIPSAGHIKEADYCGIVSGREHDKFAETGLTPIRSELVDAPYVAEFPFILECRLLNQIEIGLHTEFIGEVLDVKVEESLLGEGGVPDIEKIMPFLYAPGSSSYYAVGKLLGKAFSIGKRG